MVSANKEAALLKGVVQAVARNGLENTTTRSIGLEAGVTDAYIYRFYRDKEDLLCRAFIAEFNAYIDYLLNGISYLRKSCPTDDLIERSRFVITCAWNYLKDRPDFSRFFIRYYYSSGFQKNVSDKYKYYLDVLSNCLSETLNIKSDITIALMHLMESMFSFASKVADGQLKNDDETANCVFEQLYGVFRTAIISN